MCYIVQTLHVSGQDLSQCSDPSILFTTYRPPQETSVSRDSTRIEATLLKTIYRHRHTTNTASGGPDSANDAWARDLPTLNGHECSSNRNRTRTQTTASIATTDHHNRNHQHRTRLSTHRGNTKHNKAPNACTPIPPKVT